MFLVYISVLEAFTVLPNSVKQEFDAPDKLEEKVRVLVELLSSAKYVVVHTGAGISTSAGTSSVPPSHVMSRESLFSHSGIPDFRGPRGVWTLEKQGKKVEANTRFEDATPTLTHMSLVSLVERGVVKCVVSQNVDGLHLKSGLPRYYIHIYLHWDNNIV